MLRLSPRSLVSFRINGLFVGAQVIQTARNGSSVILVDTRGQVYDRRPDECDTIAFSVAGAVRVATNRQLHRKDVQFRVKFAAGEIEYHPRPRICRAIRPSGGRYGDVGFNEFGGTVRGRLNIEDIPLVLSEGKSSYLTSHMTERLERQLKTRRRQLCAALRSLSMSHPRRYEAIAYETGGLTWADEHGRLMDCPLPPSEVARLWGLAPCTVSNSRRRGIKTLTESLGWNPTEHLTPELFWTVQGQLAA